MFLWNLRNFVHASLSFCTNISKQHYSCWFFWILNFLFNHVYRLHFPYRCLNQLYCTIVNLFFASDWYFSWKSWKEVLWNSVSGGISFCRSSTVSCIRTWLSEDSKKSYFLQFFSFFKNNFPFNYRLLFHHHGFYIFHSYMKIKYEKVCSLEKKMILLVASESPYAVNLKLCQMHISILHLQNPFFR